MTIGLGPTDLGDYVLLNAGSTVDEVVATHLKGIYEVLK
jgi:hypothetical protein